MDKSTSSQKGSAIFGSNWKFELRKALEEKINNPLISGSEYMLPFGVTALDKEQLEFRKLLDHLPGEGTEEDLPWSASTSDKTRKDNFYDLSLYQTMKVFVKRRSYDRTSIGIRQTFKATISDGTFVDLKPQYKYWWSTERKVVSLTYYLGTLDVDKLIKESEALLGECKEVYYMYTDEGKNFLKNMV